MNHKAFVHRVQQAARITPGLGAAGQEGIDMTHTPGSGLATAAAAGMRQAHRMLHAVQGAGRLAHTAEPARAHAWRPGVVMVGAAAILIIPMAALAAALILVMMQLILIIICNMPAAIRASLPGQAGPAERTVPALWSAMGALAPQALPGALFPLGALVSGGSRERV